MEAKNIDQIIRETCISGPGVGISEVYLRKVIASALLWAETQMPDPEKYSDDWQTARRNAIDDCRSVLKNLAEEIGK